MADIAERVEKPCGSCRSVKLLDAFYRCSSACDGRDTRCIACRKEEKRKYYERNKARIKASVKRYQDKNRDLVRHRLREYARDHRDEARTRSRKHYQDNKHDYINNARAYQARKLEVFDEYVDRRLVFARDGGVCGICGKEADMDNFHVDHVIPLIRGGRHNYENVQTAHPYCNIAKRDRVEVNV